MSDGNKHDNGVHEVGTPETLQAYQEDTPGQEVEKYLAGIQEVIQEKKEKQKKSFMQVFQNPLKGFPYNEELDDNFVKPIKEGYGKIKDNHYDVKISVKKNDVKNVVKGINKLTGGNQYEYEDIDMDGVYPYGKTDGDIFIQGDDAGSLGLAIQKMFRNKVNVMGESVELQEAKNLMPAIQKIVDTKGAAKVGGVMLDMFTASVITQAYAKVNDANKKKMESANIQTLVKLAQKLMGMKEETVSESYKDVIKMYPRDNDWKKLITKHKRAIDQFRDNNKDLPKKVEDEILTWASQAGEVRGKDDAEDFIMSILDETIKESVNEAMLALSPKQYDVFKKAGIETLMKKHDAYVSDKNPRGITISSPNPKFFDLVTKLSKKPAIKRQLKGLKEGVEVLKEGTWQVPDSYDKLLNLQKFLSRPNKAKTAREVHKFHIDVDRYFGDDSFSDMLDSYYHTLPGGDIDPYDKKEKVSPKSMERAKKYNKIKPGTDLNILLMKALTDWTGGDLQFDRKGKITQMPRKWYETNNPKLNNKSNVVKATLEQKEVFKGTLEESKMSGSKLTGQEISVYFRRNKVRDKQTRKAVEIALDHGGAMNYAIKQIEKLKRGLSKNKDVQKALNYANYGEQVRIKDVGFMFKEDSPVAGNIQVEGDPYIPQKKGVNKNIAKYWKKEIKGISQKELEAVQSMYMITDHPGVVSMYKAGKRAFIKSLKD